MLMFFSKNNNYVLVTSHVYWHNVFRNVVVTSDVQYGSLRRFTFVRANDTQTSKIESICYLK